MSIYSNKLNEMTWSFSRCHCFENCRYEWYLNYLTDEEKETNFYASFGKFCHDILEKALKHKIPINKAASYYKRNFQDSILCDVPSETKTKYFNWGLSYFENLNFDWLNDYEVLGIEKKYNFTINGIKFIGYIDLLVREKETGRIIVIDHKSSEYPIGKKGKVLKKNQSSYDSYKRQLYLYSYPIYEEYGKFPDELCWNYFREQKWLNLPFISKEYDEALKWAVELVALIHNEEDFLPNINYHYCRNLCAFRNSCDYILMGG